MRISQVFICEKCNVPYSKPESAEECEKNHMSPEFTDCFYKGGESKPFRLNVGFSDDTVGIYELKRIVKLEEVEGD